MSKKPKKPSDNQKKQTDNGACTDKDVQAAEMLLEKLPENVKGQIKRLPKEQQLAAVSGIFETRSFSFKSPFPPPEIIASYKAVDQRLIDTIVDQAIREQNHRHMM